MDNGESSYRRFLDGDKNSFDELIDLYYDNLIFFLRRFLSDPSEAEEAAIDTFMQLYIKKPKPSSSVSLKTYIFMIGRSRALDRLRREKRHHHEEITDEAAHEDCQPEDAILRNELSRELNRALSLLPEQMRTAVHLVYFEELSYSDAARIMKMKEKQIDNLLYRAKNELRSLLGKDVER